MQSFHAQRSLFHAGLSSRLHHPAVPLRMLHPWSPKDRHGDNGRCHAGHREKTWRWRPLFAASCAAPALGIDCLEYAPHLTGLLHIFCCKPRLASNLPLTNSCSGCKKVALLFSFCLLQDHGRQLAVTEILAAEQRRAADMVDAQMELQEREALRREQELGVQERTVAALERHAAVVEEQACALTALVQRMCQNRQVLPQ